MSDVPPPKLFIPTKKEIKEWDDLNKLPLLETVPCAVPTCVLATTPVEHYYNREITTHMQVPISDIISIIKVLSYHIALIDELIAQCYTRRGVSRALNMYQKEQENKRIFDKSEAQAIASQYVNSILDFFTSYLNAAKEAAQIIATLFSNEDIWKGGNYCSTLLELIIVLVFKLSTLEQMVPSRKGNGDDLSFFLKLIRDPQVQVKSTLLRTWGASNTSVTDFLMSETKRIQPSNIKHIFDVLFHYIAEHVQGNDALYPSTKFAYVNMALFLMKFYQSHKNFEEAEKPSKVFLTGIPEEFQAFLLNLTEAFPVIVYLYDFTLDTQQKAAKELKTKFQQTRKASSQIKQTPLDDLLKEGRGLFLTLSTKISTLSYTDAPSESLVQDLVSTLIMFLSVFGAIMCSVQSRVSKVLANPPKIGQSLTPYERSMKYGLKGDYKRLTLALTLCRSARELIQGNLPQLNKHIVSYQQTYIQNFVRTKLSPLIKSQKKETVLSLVRILLGYLSSSDFAIPDKTPAAASPSQIPSAAPHPSHIEFARVAFEILLNSNKKGFQPLSQFLNDTKYFIQLLNLPETINIIFDQSFLYFKESHLDLCNVSFFPVSTSVPVILSDYALKNYNIPELTGAIFFPLSIYDDAAHSALCFLKSKYLYDEIKAEAQICLTSITKRISDGTFYLIRRFVALKNVPQPIIDQEKQKYVHSRSSMQQHAAGKSSKEDEDAVIQLRKSLSEDIVALRFGVILQQNQLFLLGSHVDTSSLVADRLNDLFLVEIKKIVSLIEKHGLLAMVASSKMIEILSRTQEVFCSFGIPLFPFNDLLRRTLGLDTPDSFGSFLLYSVANTISLDSLDSFYLTSYPDRLIVKSIPAINFETLFVDPKQFAGRVIESYLSPTLQCISNCSFCELFRYIDDGAIYLLHKSILSMMNEAFFEFYQLYSDLSPTLRLVQPSPTSVSHYHVFERYQAAYSTFLDTPSVKQLLSAMGKIGIAFAISGMMDNAYFLRHINAKQFSAFIYSCDPNLNRQSCFGEFFKLYDSKFERSQKWFSGIDPCSNEGEVFLPFFTQCADNFSNLLKNCGMEFRETSTDLLNIQSLRGFAAVWSILEFIFCLMETFKNISKKDGGAVEKYGEGVYICAAAILILTNQQSFFKCLSIGNQIRSHVLPTVKKPQNQDAFWKYLSFSKFSASTLDCALCSLEQALKHCTS